MLKKISNQTLYCRDYDWHICRHHFSFADYHDARNMNFGVLRALNDDIIQPSQGFQSHPHDNMEIISYCVQGELSHVDDMGNEQTLERGDVQYLCAGSGIVHSEMNKSRTQDLRFVQIWIKPDEDDLKPRYSVKKYSPESRHNSLLKVASGNDNAGSIEINQDADIFVSEIDRGISVDHTLSDTRQSYLLCVNGVVSINEVILGQHEAIKIVNHDRFSINAIEDSHILMVEMVREGS